MQSKDSACTRRVLGIPKELLVVDITTITVGLGRLPWAPHKGQKACIKLHVGIIGDHGKLHKVTETTGYEPDPKSRPDLLDWRYNLVADRAYGKHKVFDNYQEQENR